MINLKDNTMKPYLVLVASIVLFSCQNKESKRSLVPSENKVVAKQMNSINEQVGNTIALNYKDKNGLYTAESALDSIQTKVYVKFKSQNSGKLSAKIIPTTGKGNIRFNQILYPDNSSDGPFGKTLDLDITQNGTYTLVIGRSLMADNPFIGKFRVEVELTK